MTRTPPTLGDPQKPPIAQNFRPTSKEVLAYLKKRKLPITKRARLTARNRIERKRYLQSLPKGREFSVAQADAPYQVIYGQMFVGGILAFYHTSANRLILHQIHILACHEIESLVAVYLDANHIQFAGAWPSWSNGSTPYREGRPVVPYTNKIFVEHHYGEPSGSPFPTLRSIFPDFWTLEHKLLGRPAVYIQLTWDPELFRGDNLEWGFVVRGKKVLDPRTGVYAASSNVALNAADYITDGVYGLGYAWSELDTASLIEAANVCDEVVATQGGAELRYQINAAFKVDQSPDQIINEFEKSMAGEVIFSGGAWKFRAGKARTPVLTLTVDDLRSAPEIQTIAPRNDVINSVRGTFTDPARAYDVNDFPAVSVGQYVADDDGRKRWLDIDYPFIVSHPTAQRLARIELEASRRQHRITGGFGLRALELEPCDWVNVNLPRYGYDGTQTFEVEDVGISISTSDEISVDLSLRQIDAGIYAWNTATDEQSIYLGQTPTLPSPFAVDAVGSLAFSSGTDDLLITADGSIISRIHVTWDVPNDALVADGGGIQLQYKRAGEALYTGDQQLLAGTESAYIVPVQDGAAYDIRVRAVNAFSVKSAWVSGSHTVIGKTEPPSDVTGFAGATSVERLAILSWDDIADLDLAYYEVRKGADWNTAIFVGRTRDNAFTDGPLSPGDYTYLLKAYDTTGNESLAAALVVVSIARLTAPTVTIAQENTNVRLSWTAPSSRFGIREYEVRRGSDWDTALYLARVSATTIATRIDWAGAQTFQVAAVDTAGNVGDPGSTSFVVAIPSAVRNLTGQAINERVLIDWDEPATHTLPIDLYRIYKGATFAVATPIYDARGTFAPTIELTGGAYTYWVSAIDSNGNEGAPTGLPLTVLPPVDFIIRDDQVLSAAAATKSSALALEDSLTLAIPTDPSVTWLSSFGSYNTLQDEIGAGLLYYLEPGSTTGYVEWTVDYGVALSSSTLSLTWLQDDVHGAITVVPNIKTSLDGVSYTDHGAVGQAYLQTLRYAKYRLTATGSAAALSYLTQVRVRATLKKTTDSGTATVNAADSGGTVINFNLDFLDVDSIQVTPVGTIAAYQVVNFDFSSVNPTSFRVLLFDKNGNPKSGDVTWNVDGALDVLGVS
jgi:hypothetical protein